MRKDLLVLVWAVALGLTSGCIRVDTSSNSFEQGAELDLRASARVQRTGQISAELQLLEVDNRFGAVEVRGAGDGPAEWSWNLTVRAPSEALAQEAAAAARCEPDWDGKRLRLIVFLPDHKPRRLSFESNLFIRAPRSAAVQTHNQFGKTEIVELDGEVNARSGHGGIEIRNVRGAVRAETSFGSLLVSRVGPASLKNQHGKIEASDVRGDLTAETSFGALTAQAVAGNAKFVNQHGAIKGKQIGGSVEARTSFSPLDVEAMGPTMVCRNQHGALRLTSLSPALAHIEAETSFGPLDLALPTGIDPAIRARTSFGEIDSDFPIFMKPSGQDAFLGIDAGKPRITLANQHGRIRIVRR